MQLLNIFSRSQWTISLSLGAILLVPILSGFSFWSSLRYQRARAWSDHSRDILVLVLDLKLAAKKSEGLFHKLLIEDDTATLSQFYEMKKSLEIKTKQLTRLVVDNSQQTALIKETTKLIFDRRALLVRVLEPYRDVKNKKVAKLRVNKGWERDKKNFLLINDSLEKNLNLFTLNENQLFDHRSLAAEAEFTLASRLIVIGLLFAFSLLCLAALVLFREIKRRGVLEKSLVQEKSKAEENLGLKSQFLANFSQEIRTPLNGIIGMSQILKQSRIDQEQKELVTTISDSANSLLTLINGVLDISNIEAGKLQLAHIHFELRSMIKNVLNRIEVEAHKKYLNVSIEIEQSVPDLLTGDPLRIRQILSDLTRNAVRNIRSGQIVLKVSNVRGDSGTESFNFEITSRGEKAVHTVASHESELLALSVAGEIIKLMGGSLLIEDENPFDARYAFTLSLTLSEYGKENQNSDAALESKSTYEPTRILVAEDNLTNQKVITAMLKNMNCKVTAVENGLLALEVLSREKFDLIIMDGQMPELDGYEASRKIREGAAGAENSQIPIIACTANAIKGDVEKCLEAGMNDYISKPIIQTELKLKVQKWSISAANLLPFNALILRKLVELENGQNTLAMEVISIYGEIAPKQIAEMKLAIQNGSHKELTVTAQRFKSSCSNVGALKASKICEDISTLKKSEHFGRASDLVQALEVEVDYALTELIRFKTAV